VNFGNSQNASADTLLFCIKLYKADLSSICYRFIKPKMKS